MRRKFLPLFLTCALLLNSSMAFAADVNEPAEGDALTVVSEEQEKAASEEQEVVTEETTPVVLDAEGTDAAPTAITDFGSAYAALTGVGAAVSGTDTVKAVGNSSVVILDVRSTVNYGIAHLNGSINVPVFNDNGSVISTSEDDTAKAFTEYVTAHKAELDGKDIYIICNSGARGAQAATVLLAEAGYPTAKLHTVTNGATDLELRYAMYTVGTPVSGTETVAAIGNDNVVILDVRTAANYAKRHLSGSISVPTFNADGSVISTTNDETAKAFTEYVTAHKAELEGKEIYLLCNSGQRGARAAAALLATAGYDTAKLHTITNGATDLDVCNAMLDLSNAGAPVDSKTTVEAVGKDNVVIMDVRTADNYAKGHLKGSISVPTFNADGSVISRTSDDTAKAFTEYVTAHKAELEGKEIYLLCNSGARGAKAATILLGLADYDLSKVHTVTGGYKGTETDKLVQNAATYVSDTRVIEAINNGEKDVLVIDVRNTDLYAKGHLKGSLSLPLFDKDNKLPDDLAKAFSDYVAAHKADFDGKTIYVLCNSGARGAQKAIELLSAAGLNGATLRTIENGAKSELLQANFVTDEKPATTEPAKTPANNNKTPKTGDAAPIMPLALSMFAALCAIVAISKKKIVK